MKKNLLIKLRDALLKLNDIKTDKGTLVYEGELEVGTEVMIEDIDGNWIEAPDGEYRSETEIIVVVDGKVSEIKKDEEPIPAEPEEAPAEPEEPVEPEEPAEDPNEVQGEEEQPIEEPEEDKDAKIAELEARIAELEAINAELEAENADLKAKLDEAEVSLKASAAKPAKEEFKAEEKQPLVHRRKFY